MYTKSVLGIDQCQGAITAMLAEFKKDPTNLPVAMAIVDDKGDLISFARTDGARPELVRNCVKKAYTAAYTGLSTEEYAKLLDSLSWRVADLANDMLLIIPGGAVVRNPGGDAILGGIAVSGLPGTGDEDLSQIGVKALNL